MALRIPKSQIVTSKYTSGKEYMFVTTYREYIGDYYELKGKIYAGKEFNINAPELMKINSDKVNKLLTNPSTYIFGKLSGASISNFKPEVKLPDDDLDSEVKDRYFVQKTNVDPILIKEVTEASYNQAKIDPIYKTVSLKWDPIGDNEDRVVEADKKMPGLKIYLDGELENILLNQKAATSYNGGVDAEDQDTVSDEALSPEITISEPAQVSKYAPGKEPIPVSSETFRNQDVIPIGPIVIQNRPEYTLQLRFNSAASLPVASTVAAWSTFFGLTGGQTFKSVNVSSDAQPIVTIVTDIGIDVPDELLFNVSGLISIIDQGAIGSAGDKCFANISTLTTVVLKGLRTAGTRCFADSAITTLDLPSLVTAGLRCFTSLPITGVISMPLLQTAGDYCFNECGSVSLFRLPSLISIGDYGFYNCDNAEFNLPALTSAGDLCFSGCINAAEFDLPSLVSAGDECFTNLSGITLFNVPSLKYAGNQCFYLCSSATFNISSLVTAGDSCFVACQAQTIWNCPSLISIGSTCFDSCNIATSFIFPSLTTVGDGAFQFCTAVTEFYLSSVTNLGSTTGDDGVFGGITGETITLTIPDALITCNAGNPDADLTFLVSNNVVTTNGGTLIGNRIWSKVNLDVATYANGDPISEITDIQEWKTATTGAWKNYDNNTASGSIYGKLYNWHAVADPRGLAPVGYHIPTKAEWDNLIAALGGSNIAGGKLKQTGTTRWKSPNTSATDLRGFTALPGGYVFWLPPEYTGGGFMYEDLITETGAFWTSTEINATNANIMGVFYNNATLISGSIGPYDNLSKQWGVSVRVVKDI